MNILLVYPPFCTPATPPFSLTSLYSFLKTNSLHKIGVLDANALFHNLQFPQFKQFFQDMSQWDEYKQQSKEFKALSSITYSQNNKKVRSDENPDFFDEILAQILAQKPDVVALSVVYSSQAFYTYALLKELSKRGMKTIVGGPCVNEKLKQVASHYCAHEIAMLNILEEKEIDHNDLTFSCHPDYSVYNLKDYFTPHPIIPLKTSTTCYYKQCTFCDHYAKVPYKEYDLEIIKKTIEKSKQKHFFLIDDMIPKKRLLQLAEIFTPLGIYWACQLKPTIDLDQETLDILHNSGLRMVIWGVESGSQRILDLMKKGTKASDVEKVLQRSHDVGIKNVLYIMFGFPTETKDEFEETIMYLERNKENIDLISHSIFGLQQGTPIYYDPSSFGILQIQEEQRSILDPKITYEIKEGLTQQEASKLYKKNKARIDKINKYPSNMNFFRGHMLCKVSRE